MTVNNVKQIKSNSPTQLFSYEVMMLVHVVADSEKLAKDQLDEKGGIVTKRDVQLLNSTPLYGETGEK